MQAPKRRTSRAKRNRRRSHDALRPANPGACPKCGEPALPHRVCRHCGSYRGRELVQVEE